MVLGCGLLVCKTLAAPFSLCRVARPFVRARRRATKRLSSLFPRPSATRPRIAASQGAHTPANRCEQRSHQRPTPKQRPCPRARSPPPAKPPPRSVKPEPEAVEPEAVEEPTKAPSSTRARPTSRASPPTKTATEYAQFHGWVERCLEAARADLSGALFPVFAHCYCSLVDEGNNDEASRFLERWAPSHDDRYASYVESLRRASSKASSKRRPLPQALVEIKIQSMSRQGG